MKHLCSLHVGADELLQKVAFDWSLREPEREGERTDIAQRRGNGEGRCVFGIGD